MRKIRDVLQTTEWLIFVLILRPYSQIFTGLSGQQTILRKSENSPICNTSSQPGPGCQKACKICRPCLRASRRNPTILPAEMGHTSAQSASAESAQQYFVLVPTRRAPGPLFAQGADGREGAVVTANSQDENVSVGRIELHDASEVLGVGGANGQNKRGVAVARKRNRRLVGADYSVLVAQRYGNRRVLGDAGIRQRHA